jgi:hypothetical protein
VATCSNHCHLSLPAVAAGGPSKQAEDNVLIRDCTRGARGPTKGFIKAMKYLVQISRHQIKLDVNAMYRKNVMNFPANVRC